LAVACIRQIKAVTMEKAARCSSGELNQIVKKLTVFQRSP
jgi:hypothetical protein